MVTGTEINLVPSSYPVKNKRSYVEVVNCLDTLIRQIERDMTPNIESYLEGQIKSLFWLMYNVSHVEAGEMAREAIRQAQNGG